MNDLSKTSSPDFPTTHPRACASCVRAKAKCVAEPDLRVKCQRCFRLKKECVRSLSTERKRRVVKPTRVAQIEDKLDGLVMLLKSVQVPKNGARGLDSALGSIMSSADSLKETNHFSSSSQLVSPRLAEDGEKIMGLPTPRTNSSTYQSPEAYTSCGLDLSLEEATILLDTFRSQIACHFPFVTISPTMAVRELRQERPFLYMCVMAVASKSPSQQISLGEEVMRYLSERLLLQGEKSLDLLLGILAYTGWWTVLNRICFYRSLCQCQTISRLTTLLQLALGQLFELGLNKPAPTAPKISMLDEPFNVPQASEVKPLRTLEEQRAYVGCFFLASAVSTCFQRMDSLRWTPYIDECLRSLTEAREYETDVHLVYFVRLQCIVERIYQSPWHDGSCFNGGLPPVMYLRPLQAQLQEFKRGLPEDLEQNALIRMQYHSAEISLYESGLYQSSSPSSITNLGFDRLEILYTCLQSTKSFFEAFLSIPPALYLSLSVNTFTQLIHSLVVVHKLSLLEDPDWDLEHVRETVSFPNILGQLIAQFGEANSSLELDSVVADEMDTFSRSIRKFRQIKTRYEAKLGINSLDSEVSVMGNVGVDADVVLVEDSFAFLDEPYWLDVLGWRAAGQPESS